MAVKLKSGGFQGKGADKWYVTDGMNAVGPVELTLLVRGVEAGRVPLDSFVRHEAWKVWRPLADFALAAHLSALDYMGDIDWEAAGETRDWYSRIKSRPAFRTLLNDRVLSMPPHRGYADLDF